MVTLRTHVNISV